MSLSQLLPLTAAILAPVAERISDSVTEGLSFANLFRNTETERQESAEGSGEAPGGGPLEISAATRSGHLRKFAEQELTKFLDRLRVRFEAHRIDTNLPVQLKTSASGEVHVDGEHPHRAEIESLFRSDPQLAETFGRVSAAFSSIERQGDPRRLTDREFRLTLAGGQPSIQFV